MTEEQADEIIALLTQIRDAVVNPIIDPVIYGDDSGGTPPPPEDPPGG